MLQRTKHSLYHLLILMRCCVWVLLTESWWILDRQSVQNNSEWIDKDSSTLCTKLPDDFWLAQCPFRVFWFEIRADRLSFSICQMNSCTKKSHRVCTFSKKHSLSFWNLNLFSILERRQMHASIRTQWQLPFFFLFHLDLHRLKVRIKNKNYLQILKRIVICLERDEARSLG